MPNQGKRAGKVSMHLKQKRANYRASNKRVINKAIKLERHKKKYPNDTVPLHKNPWKRDAIIEKKKKEWKIPQANKKEVEAYMAGEQEIQPDAIGYAIT